MLSLTKKELELRSRACMLLEKTKMEPEKYSTERKTLFSLENASLTSDSDYSYWDNLVSKIEDLVFLDEKFSSLKHDSSYLQKLSMELKNQKFRHTDTVHNIGLFKIVSHGKEHFFLTRYQAEQFLQKCDEKNLEIIECCNLELEELLKLIEKNF